MSAQPVAWRCESKAGQVCWLEERPRSLWWPSHFWTITPLWADVLTMAGVEAMAARHAVVDALERVQEAYDDPDAPTDQERDAAMAKRIAALEAVQRKLEKIALAGTSVRSGVEGPPAEEARYTIGEFAEALVVGTRKRAQDDPTPDGTLWDYVRRELERNPHNEGGEK